MKRDKLDEAIEELRTLRELAEGREEVLRAIDNIEDSLTNIEQLTLICLKRISRDNEKMLMIVNEIRRDRELRDFAEYVKRPWIANKALALAVQLLWIAIAAISFMMGVYLFFPTYVFFGGTRIANSTAIIWSTLELISKNPQILAVVDPLFKILGLAMIAVAIVSLYQAHAIGSLLREE